MAFAWPIGRTRFDEVARHSTSYLGNADLDEDLDYDNRAAQDEVIVSDSSGTVCHPGLCQASAGTSGLCCPSPGLAFFSGLVGTDPRSVMGLSGFASYYDVLKGSTCPACWEGIPADKPCQADVDYEPPHRCWTSPLSCEPSLCLTPAAGGTLASTVGDHTIEVDGYPSDEPQSSSFNHQADNQVR